jgi:heme-degrading monooxygenase HmoA
MIARSWHGVVPYEKAEAFHSYLLVTGAAEAKATPGCLGVHIQSVRQYGLTHFFMISFWESFEAVRAFAGPNPNIAVTYPEDLEYGLISDPVVLHHEIVRIPPELTLV